MAKKYQKSLGNNADEKVKMKWLSQKEIDKYNWVAGGSDDLIEFRGWILDEFALNENQLRTALEELGLTPNKHISQNIKTIFLEIKRNPKLKCMGEWFPFKSKFKKLNEIRIYAAHGVSSISEYGIIISKDDDDYRALVFNEDLVQETKSIANDCSIFLGELHNVLGLIEH